MNRELMEMLKDSLDGMNAKLDKLDSRLDNVDITLVKQHAQLEEHIRRTNLLESEVKPIKEHVSNLRGIGKLIAILGSIVGLILSLKALFPR